MEFWRAGGPPDLDARRAAVAVEAAGWDGQMFMDSQSLGADPWATMGYWAASTSTLWLATGVTNPVTRHPAVTAAAAAGLQAMSGGRVVLGIGRGDSALAYLGFAPARFRQFERAVRDLQQLLRGGEIEFSAPAFADGLDSAAALAMGERPGTTSLSWLPPEVPKVPLDVAATGPRVIALGARLADRVTFSVGADPARLAWALGHAVAADRPGTADPVSYGAQVVVVPHRDPATVIAAATAMVLPLARFQVIEGPAAGPTAPGDAKQYAAIRRGYAMTRHSDFAAADKLSGGRIDVEFVRRFAVVGTPEECADRLIELARLGLDRFVVFGPGGYDDGTPDGSLFTREVMPAVREAMAADTGGPAT